MILGVAVLQREGDRTATPEITGWQKGSSRRRFIGLANGVHHILSRLQSALARHGEARVIGHCDPAFLGTAQGAAVRQAITSASAEVGMSLAEHCEIAPE
jgi:hypothetical protein